MTNSRVLHINVYSDSEVKANIKLPLNLLKTSARFPALALNLIPKEVRADLQKNGLSLQDINMGELVRMVESGQIKENFVDIEILDPIEGRVYVKMYIDQK